MVENSHIVYLGDSGSTKQITTSGFALGIRYMKVTRRFPQSGTPKSIDVELQTDRNWGYGIRYPISTIFCPNAKVVARDPASGTVLGSSIVDTSVFSNCVGTGRIPLDFSKIGHVPPTIQIQAFEDTVNVQNLSGIKPLSTLNLPISQSYSQGLSTGIYSKPSTAASGIFGSVLGNHPVRNIALTLGIGFGGYFLVANRKAIEKLIKG
ncbi:MAG TPA: hypothetical protein VKA34_19315 [Balneolales bacterium]|nr:hypothetical protein [Balneolales bacterium]